MIDDKQTGINFNQTMHDINNFNKINEANLKLIPQLGLKGVIIK